MQSRVDACPAELRDSLLLQYANPVRRTHSLL
jgi:hypothetical protein